VTPEKADLHRHLEGSIRPGTLIECRRDLGLSTPDHFQVLHQFDDLSAVLNAFELYRSIFTLNNIERIAAEAVEDAAADGLTLLELRFSPDFMARPHSLEWNELMERIISGVDRATTGRPIAVDLVVIVSRCFGVESALESAKFAARWRERVVGFDFADEELRPASQYGAAVRIARDAGLGLTVHTGENTGPDAVWDVIESLHPDRLGHGVAVGRDEKLAAYCAENEILIESCPTSNYRTRAVSDLGSHPARSLLRRGVPLAICSDDPGLFDITLSHEFDVARRQMGFDDDDLAAASRNAVQHAFRNRSNRRRHFELRG
jgi:adenosine deaminase